MAGARSKTIPWEGPKPSEPDSEAVGPAIMAWYALHDGLAGGPEEAADTVAWAADVIAGKLGAFGPGVVNPLTPGQARVAIREAQLLLEYIAEIFGRWRVPVKDDVTFPFKAELKRQRGRPAPSQIHPESLAWWFVARDVQSLIDGGLLQKQAVGQVAKQLGLKDAVVARWCRERRKALEQSKARWECPEPEI